MANWPFLIMLSFELFGRLKIVWMLKSSLVFWRQIKLDRHIPPSMLHMPCTWNLKIKLELQMKYLIVGYPCKFSLFCTFSLFYLVMISCMVDFSAALVLSEFGALSKLCRTL